MARIHLVRNKEDIAPEHYPLFEELAALRGLISGPSTVVLNSPPLARPWNEISEYLHRKSIVEDPHAELAVMTTAREKDCQYVFSAHVRIGRRVGVPEASIECARGKTDTTGLPEHDAMVITYTRQLLRQNRVQQPVFDFLLNAHGPAWLIELTAWIGRYGALAGLINAFEVPAGEGGEPLPAMPFTTPPTGSPVAPPLAQPRVPLVNDRDMVPAEHQPIFDAIIQARGAVRGPFALVMHSPPLAKLFVDLDSYLRTESPLQGPLRELIMLATAREKDCRFVWAAHVPYARQLGLSEATIAAVAMRGDLSALPEADRDTAEYVRQLLRTNRVPQVLFDRIRNRHGVPWMVEMTCLMGQYGILAGIINACELAPDPEREQMPLG